MKMMQLTTAASNAQEIKFVLGGTKYVNSLKGTNVYRRYSLILEDVDTRIQWGLIDPSYVTASKGMAWAIGTARVNSHICTWLGTCSVSDFLKVLDEVKTNCKTMTDVPYYLNTLNVVDMGLNEEGITVWKRVK